METLNLILMDSKQRTTSIDTSNKTYRSPEIINQTKVDISIKQNSPYFAIQWQDTAYYDFRPGMHFFRISSKEKNKVKDLYQEYYLPPFLEMLNEADSNDIFIVGYNAPGQLQKEFLYALYQTGFEKAKNIKPMIIGFLCYKKQVILKFFFLQIPFKAD